MNNMMWLSYICMYVRTSLWHHHKLVILAHLWPFFTSPLCLFLIAPSTGPSSINRHPFTLLLYSLCHCQTNSCHYFLPEEPSSHLCTCYPFSLLPSRHHFCCLKRWIVWALHTDIHTIHMHTDTRLYVCVFVSDTLIWSCRGSIAVLGIITLTALLLMTMLILLLTVRWSGGQWS